MTDVKDKQRLKAEVPIDVTLSGMVIDAKLEHSSKALFPMDVTELPQVTLVKLEQL